MKGHLHKFVIISLVIALFAFSVPAFAQPNVTPVPPPNVGAPIESVDEGISLLEQILTWIATIFWIVAIIFVLYAGFLYLTAGGDSEKVQKANHQLIYAVIAIIVGLMAFGLPLLVENFLEGN